MNPNEHLLYSTPGPWHWFERPPAGTRLRGAGVYLATPHLGHLLVMDFVRLGMNGAQPRFAIWTGARGARNSGLMRPAIDLAVADHPDGQLIAAAPDYALLLRAILVGTARWEFFTGSTSTGEICCGGMRYTTKLDRFGIPELAHSRQALMESFG